MRDSYRSLWLQAHKALHALFHTLLGTITVIVSKRLMCTAFEVNFRGAKQATNSP